MVESFETSDGVRQSVPKLIPFETLVRIDSLLAMETATTMSARAKRGARASLARYAADAKAIGFMGLDGWIKASIREASPVTLGALRNVGCVRVLSLAAQ